MLGATAAVIGRDRSVAPPSPAARPSRLEPGTPDHRAHGRQTRAVAPVAGPGGPTRPAIEQVYVPAGTFRMGTDQADIDTLLAAGPPDWVTVALPSEAPAHDVTLTSGYWIDTTEVTERRLPGVQGRRRLHHPGLLVARRAGRGSAIGSSRDCRSAARVTPPMSPAAASHGSRRRPMPRGAAVACRPRPSGSSPPVARPRPSIPGATTGTRRRRTSSTATDRQPSGRT